MDKPSGGLRPATTPGHRSLHPPPDGIRSEDVSVDLDLHIIRHEILQCCVEVWGFALHSKGRDRAVVVYAYQFPDKGGVQKAVMKDVESKDVVKLRGIPLLSYWEPLLLDCQGFRAEKWDSNIDWFLGALKALHAKGIMPGAKLASWTNRLRHPPSPISMGIETTSNALECASLSQIDQDDISLILIHLACRGVPFRDLKVVGVPVGATKLGPNWIGDEGDRFWQGDLTFHWKVSPDPYNPRSHKLYSTVGVGPRLARYLADGKVNLRQKLKAHRRRSSSPMSSLPGRTPLRKNGVCSETQQSERLVISKDLLSIHFRRPVACSADMIFSRDDIDWASKSDSELRDPVERDKSVRYPSRAEIDAFFRHEARHNRRNDEEETVDITWDRPSEGAGGTPSHDTRLAPSNVVPRQPPARANSSSMKPPKSPARRQSSGRWLGARSSMDSIPEEVAGRPLPRTEPSEGQRPRQAAQGSSVEEATCSGQASSSRTPAAQIGPTKALDTAKALTDLLGAAALRAAKAKAMPPRVRKAP